MRVSERKDGKHMVVLSEKELMALQAVLEYHYDTYTGFNDTPKNDRERLLLTATPDILNLRKGINRYTGTL